MANYDSSLQSGNSEETAVSTSQTLTSPCESMWDGWTTQTSSADADPPSISLTDLQVQGSSVHMKGSTNFQSDLLSSWLSGFQTLSQAAGVLGAVDHDQPQSQDHTLVYPDEFSRLNICSTSSDERPDGVAHSESSHASQLFIERCSDQSIMRTDREFCETPVTEESSKREESAPYFRSTSAPNQSSNFDKVARNTEQDQHMVQTPEADLSSRTSSPPSMQLASYGQMMQHLVGQYESNPATTWLSCVTTSSSQLRPSDNGLRPVQGDLSRANTSSESIILHHHRPGSSNFSSANDPYCNTAENMYAELHGLLTKTQQDSLAGTIQLPQAPATTSAGGWSQFTDATMQGQQSMFASDASTAATTPKPTNRTEDPSSSHAGKSRASVVQVARPNPERQGKRSSRGHEDESGSTSPAVKRSCIEHAIWQSNAAFLGRVSDPKFHASLGSGYGIGTSSGLDIHSSVGPALNTNGKPRARRGSATDPQSVYARHRRERITERLKILQHLVPNGAKVDIVTMLEEAISYVKFLQLQVRLLSSDEYWIYAPTTYNGVDVSMGMHFQGMDSQA
ncbi:hypothetical protein Mapa_017599 [Marchantia paleacea]|nr:hypothetical protein Mapa_017599 [Marchantia paleacea]